MIWHNMHPVVQIFIICILCGMIGGGIGYMRYIIHEARARNRLRRIKTASKPVDYTQIDFTTYDSKARIKRIGHELREMSRKGKGA
jgi:hypothetical protein